MKLYMLIDCDDNCHFIEANSLDEALQTYEDETGLTKLRIVDWIYAE